MVASIPSASAALTVSAVPAQARFTRKDVLIHEGTGKQLPLALCGIIASYAQSYFGPSNWSAVYDKRVDDFVLNGDVFTWLASPDPFDPTKSREETHEDLVLRPKEVTDITTGVTEAFSLNLLGKLMQNPREGGNRCRYNIPASNDALEQHGETPAGPACLIAIRKGDIFFRNKVEKDQIKLMQDLNAKIGIGYEVQLDGLDVATAISTCYTTTGRRHIGDATGEEGRYSGIRCAQRVRVLGEAIEVPMGIINFAPGSFYVYCTYDGRYESTGVLGLRKFS